MAIAVRQTWAVARKELSAELRTRYALNATGMFVLVTVATLLFALGRSQALEPSVAAALLLIALFFTGAVGLSRIFVAEQERGTMLLLRLTLSSTPVFFGKLLFNLLLGLASNLLVALLVLLLLPDLWGAGAGMLFALVVVLSLGFASALTIVSALVSRASARNALTPVLAFPVVLPLVVSGSDLLRRAAGARPIELVDASLLIVLGFPVLVASLGYVLFDLIWKE